MAEMTDEEAWKLAELFEKNPPKVSGTGKGGFFMRRKEATRMLAAKKSVIHNLVKNELAAV